MLQQCNQHAHGPSLELRRQVSSIILLYKIVPNLIHISPIDLLPVTSSIRGHNQRFHHIYARTATQDQ